MPLREGGSLPALVEADDGFKYVLKFRGAGNGIKLLIAELIGGLIAKKLGFKVPELVFADLDEAFGKTEGDEEIQDLLKWSRGLNLGLHFLPGSFAFDPVAHRVDANLASKVVWFDAFLTNIDRTARNTNMLMFNKELWLIDHGASLYFHHSWNQWQQHAQSSFALVKNHVLLPFADAMHKTNEEFSALLSDDFLYNTTRQIPDDWLQWEGSDLSPDDIRDVYFQFLSIRLKHSQTFTEEAHNARKLFV